MQNLVRIAHKIADDYGHEKEADEIIEAVHELRGRSLHGSVPESSVMSGLSNLLKDNQIDFAVIGAVALIIHGVIRNTDDIDVLVSELPPSDKLSDPRYMEKFAFYKAKSSTGTVLTIDHRKNGQVELLTATDPLKQLALSTAEEHMVLGHKVPVVSAAALIGLKVQALVNNPSREAKDAPDILSIWLKSKPDLSEVRKFLSETENEALDKIVKDKKDS
jgi:hypothetical protein